MLILKLVTPKIFFMFNAKKLLPLRQKPPVPMKDLPPTAELTREISSTYAQPKSGARQSNLELLRIVAMLMVLAVHANFGALDYVRAPEITAAPVSAFSRFFWESACLICVNLFVLISGYFSIRLSLKRVVSYIFIVVFWSVLPAVSFLIIPANSLTSGISIETVWESLIPLTGNWFISAYFILMLFAPILNSWVETCGQKRLLASICALCSLMFYFWGMVYKADFNDGYSALSFFVLYLIGRYLKLYPGRINCIPTVVFPFVFLATTLGLTLLGFYGVKENIQNTYSWYIPYCSPFTMVGTIAFFLSFTRLKFQSRAVNFFAVSAFSVFLAHFSVFVYPYFKFAAGYLYDNLSTAPYAFAIVGYISGIYLTVTVIDRIRIALWEGILKLVNQRQKR